jgi:hypothetical protein
MSCLLFPTSRSDFQVVVSTIGVDVLDQRLDWLQRSLELTLPPEAIWKAMPGFDWIQRSLELTSKAAFTPEGFLLFLNRTRREGEPELTKVPLTVEGLADVLAGYFAAEVERWG